MRYVITFDCVHFVMKAQKVLMERGMSIRLTPIPRQISSDCGMAIEMDIPEGDLEKVRMLLEDQAYGVESIHGVHE